MRRRGFGWVWCGLRIGRVSVVERGGPRSTTPSGIREADELGGGEAGGGSGAVALGHGFEGLGVDGDVGFRVEVAFDDGDEEVEREALVGGGDEGDAAGGDLLESFDVLKGLGTVEPGREGADGDFEPARDLGEGLIRVGVGGEDVVGGFGSGMEDRRRERRSHGATKGRILACG